MQGLRQYDSKLDPNWIHLILAAKQIGITVEDIRKFLRQSPPGTKKPAH
ncbi:MAG: Anti-repressor SinI [Paenibacillus sp.]|nr:Anti-repressor SinI [Paenibacillus sp.]